MKNSIIGYDDKEVISEYIEGADRLLVYNIEGDLIPKYCDVDTVTEEMIKQTGAYISDIKQVKDKTIARAFMSILMFLMTVAGGIVTVGAAILLLFTSIPASIVAIVSFMGLLFVYENNVREYVIKTSDTLELYEDKLKYETFMDELENINEYEELSMSEALVNINTIDDLTNEELKAKLGAMSAHLRLIKQEMDSNEKAKTKTIRQVK